MKKFLFLIVAITFIRLSAQVNFTSSSLPVIIIDTNGKPIADEPKIEAAMKVIDNGEGKQNYITDTVYAYEGKIGIEVRGHSSQMFPKKQYGIELRDDAGNDKEAPLLGMPEESDWVLNASYTDKSLLRNVIVYKLGNDLGHYASRTRYCEVLIDEGSGLDYKGIYILQEKVKRDKNRVNIKKLEPTDLSGDRLTGGYILKIDRIDPGDKYFNSRYPSVYPKTPSQPSPVSYIIEYPKTEEIQPAQFTYINNFIDQFESTLTKLNYNDPFDGYTNYIDLDAWVDYYLVSEFAKATDAYRLSAYLHKDRDSEGGKLVFGPLWDYDLTFGLANYDDGYLINGWQANYKYGEGIWHPTFWITKILNDPIFYNRLAKRWHTIKESVFEPSKLLKFIDETTTKMYAARIRNFQRWPELFSGIYIWPNKNNFRDYESEILYLKGWIVQRYNWINGTLPSNYADVEWKDPGKLFYSEKEIKLPLSIFCSKANNISNIEFVSKDPNITFKLSGDSLTITATKGSDYSFKGVAKKNGLIVSISPLYNINLTTGVASRQKIPAGITLNQNYPNPFSIENESVLGGNSETNISFTIDRPTFVTLKIFDTLGQEVAVLANNFLHAGSHVYRFSSSMAKLNAGVYFYVLQVGETTLSKKMLLLR